MNEPRYVLGVDGGASKTVALVSDRRGRVVGAGRAGNCDLYSNGARALDEVALAVQEALSQAGISPTELSFGLFSLCGADWPEDFDTFAEGIRARNLAGAFQVVNDAIGALGATVPDGDGVIVVCGTGAATGSRNAEGDIWHTSFWQGTQGGHELARSALLAVYRAELEIAPPTALTELLLGSANAPSVEALLHRYTNRIRPRNLDLNRIPPLVFDAAEAGDKTALQVAVDHASALGDYGVAAARKVGILERPFDLVLAGGLLQHPSPIFGQALMARVRASAPAVRPRVSAGPPVKGALLMALRASGISLSPAIEAEIDASLPQREFFSTHRSATH